MFNPSKLKIKREPRATNLVFLLCRRGREETSVCRELSWLRALSACSSKVVEIFNWTKGRNHFSRGQKLPSSLLNLHVTNKHGKDILFTFFPNVQLSARERERDSLLWLYYALGFGLNKTFNIVIWPKPKTKPMFECFVCTVK